MSKQLSKEQNDFSIKMQRKMLLENYIEQLTALKKIMERLNDTEKVGRSVSEESFDKYHKISQSAFVLNLNLKKALIIALEEAQLIEGN